MIDENSLLLWVIGLIFTTISVAVIVIQRIVGNKPLIKLLEVYKKNQNFIDSKFEVIENCMIVGKVNGISIEMTPGLKESGGMKFTLTINLSEKPYYNNSRNLENALGGINPNYSLE